MYKIIFKKLRIDYFKGMMAKMKNNGSDLQEFEAMLIFILTEGRDLK